jgi:hypothetical protein
MEVISISPRRAARRQVTRRDQAKRPRRALGITATLVVVGFTSLYAEEIRKTFSTSENPTVEVRTQAGRLKVKGWDQNQVGVSGQSSDAMKLSAEGDARKVSIQSEPLREKLSREEAQVNLEISVPKKATVHVKSDRGAVEVDSLEGGVLTVDGVSTDVDVSGVQGDISVQTVDGPIQLLQSHGRIRVESISGDMKFLRVGGSEFVANTNSGSISFEGDFSGAPGARPGSYVLSSYSAPIEVIAARTASFHVSARSVQGLIQNNLTIRPTAEGNSFRRLPGRYVEGRFNAGDAILEINSFSGTIRLTGGR